MRLLWGVNLIIFLIVTNFSSVDFVNASVLNRMAPQFTLQDSNDHIHRLKDWRGKLIIINFWATWCAPCKEEIPLLNELQKEYGDDGLQMVGIAIDNEAAIKQFTAVIPINYVNLIGGTEGSKLVSQYGNKAGVLPYTVVVNQQGVVISVAKGLLTKKYLRQTIEKYL